MILNTNSPLVALSHLDASTAFFYNPRTVTILALAIIAIAYTANVFPSSTSLDSGATHASLWDDPHPTPHNDTSSSNQHAVNVKSGVWASVLVFLAYSSIHGPTSALVRPHPALWRLVHGLLVVYVLFLVFLVYQDVDDARQFLKVGVCQLVSMHALKAADAWASGRVLHLISGTEGSCNRHARLDFLEARLDFAARRTYKP